MHLFITRPVITRTGYNAVGRVSLFFFRQGEYMQLVEMTVIYA